MADLKKNSIKKDIAIALAAAVIAACPSNTLILYTDLSAVYIDAITVISRTISIAMVLSIQPWKPKADSPTRMISSILFVFGALAVCLLFNRYWMEFARSFDPTGEQLGALVPLRTIDSRKQEILFATVLAPISEEIIFRLGFIGILSRILPTGLTLIISTAIFAIPHLYVYSTIQMVLITFSGLILGLVYIFAGLSYSMLLHSILNAWPILQTQGLQTKPVLLTIFVLCLVGLFVFIYRIFRLRRIFEKTTK